MAQLAETSTRPMIGTVALGSRPGRGSKEGFWPRSSRQTRPARLACGALVCKMDSLMEGSC